MPGKVVVIGAGINGLVAANYLQRDGFSVTLLEKQDTVGGACAMDTVTFAGAKYQYACGASVLGFMQDFVFQETGLSRKLTVFAPQHPPVVFFEGDASPCYMYDDIDLLAQELQAKWGETGDVAAYYADLDRVVQFLCQGYRKAQVPTLESANKHLGCETVQLWISGSARDLLNKYFTSDAMKVFAAMDVVESGPVPLDSPYSAFTIPLMASGTIFGGKWGFVRGRIWSISQAMHELNRELGVEILTSAQVLDVSADSLSNLSVRYRRHNSSEQTLAADYVVFATDPVSAAAMIGQTKVVQATAEKRMLGTSGKLVLFFKQPVVWKGDSFQSEFDVAFKFVVSAQNLDELEAGSQAAASGETDYAPGFCEIYCEGAAMRHLGESPTFDIVSAFVKNLAFAKRGDELPAVQRIIEGKILGFIENAQDLIGSVLLTPKDLQLRFDFPEGNIDHIELCHGQTFFTRNWSSDPAARFYQFGDNERIMYCAAGSYPCGSIAGTPGYMCASQISKMQRPAQ